jgi:hypothetical protein
LRLVVVVVELMWLRAAFFKALKRKTSTSDYTRERISKPSSIMFSARLVFLAALFPVLCVQARTSPENDTTIQMGVGDTSFILLPLKVRGEVCARHLQAIYMYLMPA